jgi:lipopolysaccharide assembly outer membrane protein LptD (OstA)
MQINSNAIAWDINQEIVKSNVPVRVIHQGENIRVAGNKAEMKLPEKTVYLTGDVKAIGQRNQYLKSERLTWYLERKLVEAQGKVIYHQMEPPLTFQGSTAIGNLATENIIVKGGSSQVVTEVIPQQVITPSLGER